MQNIFVFYCDGDVPRHTIPANTVLTMKKCDHLRREINVHLEILLPMKNEEDPKKPKALFTISLELRVCSSLFVVLFSKPHFFWKTFHKIPNMQKIFLGKNNWLVGQDFYLNSSQSNTFFFVCISVTVIFRVGP